MLRSRFLTLYLRAAHRQRYAVARGGNLQDAVELFFYLPSPLLTAPDFGVKGF